MGPSYVGIGKTIWFRKLFQIFNAKVDISEIEIFHRQNEEQVYMKVNISIHSQFYDIRIADICPLVDYYSYHLR